MVEAKDQVFNLGSRYQPLKELGKGAYGTVQLCSDKKTGKKVAVKKLNRLEDAVDAKRALREIRILRCMKHENILELLNIIFDDSDPSKDFGDVYLVTNYMEIDLFKVIRSKQGLTDDHRQYIIYQLLRGLKYLHSANIIHRDLKPSNILATENCDIRMCDFGLSRNIEDEKEDGLTEYVVTRYYRSPEIMLSSHDYNMLVDMWAVGCIFVELITGKILFQGQNYIKLIKLIFEILGKKLKIIIIYNAGKPQEDDLSFITNENAKKYIKSLPSIPQKKISEFVKYENEMALDLIQKMLEINPKKRITAAEALRHPYFEDIHNEEDEPIFKGELDFKFEHDKKITQDDLRKEILKEINLFKELNNEPFIDIPKTIQEAKSKKTRRRSLLEEKKMKQQSTIKK